MDNLSASSITLIEFENSKYSAVVYTGFRGWGDTVSNGGTFYTGEIKNWSFFKLERFQKIFKINEKFTFFEKFRKFRKYAFVWGATETSEIIKNRKINVNIQTFVYFHKL